MEKQKNLFPGEGYTQFKQSLKSQALRPPSHQVWECRTDLLNMTAVHVAREDLLLMICRYPIAGLTAFSLPYFSLIKNIFYWREKCNT